MTGPADLYKYEALLLPWDVRGLRSLAAYFLNRTETPASAWHDGDTFNALVSRGEHDYGLMHIRTAGYNAPELKTGQPGADATTFARSLVETGEIVYLDSIAFVPADEEDDFGRMLGFVTLADGRDLATVMIDSGNAVADPAAQRKTADPGH